MTKWIYRVRLKSGVYIDVSFPAIAPSIARSMAEAQYGTGNVFGYIGQER